MSREMPYAWKWASISPGRTVPPRASYTWSAVNVPPMSTIRPFSTCTGPSSRSADSPSKTIAFTIDKLMVSTYLLGPDTADVGDVVTHQLFRAVGVTRRQQVQQLGVLVCRRDQGVAGGEGSQAVDAGPRTQRADRLDQLPVAGQ